MKYVVFVFNETSKEKTTKSARKCTVEEHGKLSFNSLEQAWNVSKTLDEQGLLTRVGVKFFVGDQIVTLDLGELMYHSGDLRGDLAKIEADMKVIAKIAD